MKKITLAVLSVVLAGCMGGAGSKYGSVASEYKGLAPTDAVVGIARSYGVSVSSLVETKMNNQFYATNKSALDIINVSMAYCVEAGGRVVEWPGRRGSFNCINVVGEKVFSLGVKSLGGDSVELSLFERTDENKDVYDLFLSGAGYVSPERVAALEEEERQRRQTEIQRQQEERRARNSNLVVGDQVCQEKPYMRDAMVLQGTVEQVAGDRIKVFVERAYIKGAPNLAPGGFRQHYGWVNILAVERCD